MTEEPKIISRNYLLCMGMSFCAGLNFFILVVSVAGFALTQFHVSESEAGLAVGIYVIGGLIGRFAFGKYIELVGRKRMLLIVIVFAILMSIMYNGAYTFTELCVIRFFHGVSYGLASSCITAIVSKALPPQRRGEGMGYYYLSTTLAMCIGPLLGLYFSGKENYEFIFSVGVILYTAALILAAFIIPEEEELTDEQIDMAKSFNLKNMLELSVIPLALSAMLMFLSYSTVNSFMSSYTQEIGLRDTALFFYLTVALGSLVSRLLGKYYDTYGANKLVIPGFASFIIGMFLFTTMTSAIQMYIAGVMVGFGYAMMITVGQTAVMSRVEPHRYGVTTSTFTSILDIGTGCGPMFLGFLIPMIGYRGMYFMGVIIAILALVLYWFVFGRTVGNIPGKEQQKVSW